MNIGFFDIAALVFYLCVVAFMGFYFARKNKNTEQYFLGGRAFGGFVVGISLVGTSISSVTFIAFPADTFRTSWLRFLTALMLPLGIYVASRFFLPIFRKGNIVSAYEFLEERFGASVRTYAASVFIIAQLVRVSLILYLLALLVYEITNFNPIVCVIITGVFVSIYTITGGINAVIWTDVIQTIVLILGGLLCLFIIVDKLPGGFAEIIRVGIGSNKLTFAEYINGEPVPLRWGVSLYEKTFSMMFILGITGFLTEYCSNQNVIQRYCACKSIGEARKAMWTSAFLSLPIWAFYMFLGTALFVFFAEFPTLQTTEMLEGVRKSEQVLPFFIINYLPSGVLGIVLAAAISAAMSSLDSNINAISTIFVVDIYKRYIAKDKADSHYLKTAWTAAVATSIIMMAGAVVLLSTSTQTLQDTYNILVSVLGGGMLGIYMMGFFTKIGDWKCIWVGIVFTTSFTIWTILSGNNIMPIEYGYPFDYYYVGLLGNILMFVLGFFIALLLPNSRKITN